MALIMEKMRDTSLWFYRGEGNDTVVVGYRGNNLVLRLKKRPRHETSVSGSDVKNDSDVHDRSLDFSKHVFLPLMGGKYVRVGEIVFLPDGFAAQLDSLCEPFRPKHRLHKGIDTSAKCAIAMADFCFLPEDQPWDPHLGVIGKIKNNCVAVNSSVKPSFSVELKPKCGFIPSSPYIKEEHLIKHSVCYYCMLQGMKVSEGKYTRPSQYCPVNLFSGDMNRVYFALQTLVFDPQNNLRIFKDGFPIFTEEIVQEAIKNAGVCCPAYVLEKTLMSCGWTRDTLPTLPQNTCENHDCEKLGDYSRKFMEIILQILVHDSNFSGQNIPRSMDAAEQVCKRNGLSHVKDHVIVDDKSNSFGCGGVLRWMHLVQKMDDIDVEGLYPLYLKVKTYFECNPEERKTFTVDGPYTAGIWSDVSKTNSTDLILETHPLNKNQMDTWSTRDIVFKLCQFAVASTAKDCSVMLTFQNTFTQPKHLPFIVNNDTRGPKEYIVYNIDLVDLDPKEFDRVKKYHNDSCKAVRHYLQNL
jgi:inositol-pentakisphosphate 2-kinase